MVEQRGASITDELTRSGSEEPGTPAVRRIALDGLPDDTFIIESAAIETLLFGRSLVGDAFAHECLLSSIDFCRAFRDKLDVSEISELCILNGGRYYGLASAYNTVFGRPLPVNELKATRYCDENGGWHADISYRSYSAKTHMLLVGDTVATGVSAQVALEDFFAYHTPDEVIFFTICGGIPGARAIAETCARHNVRLTFVFGVAAFGLAENGTDLPFLHPDTVTASRYIEHAREVYGGQPVCAIGDWGERGEDPEAYLANWDETRRQWGLK